MINFLTLTVQVEVVNQHLCSHCRGTGADGRDHVGKCNQCGGQGIILQRQQIAPGFFQQVQRQYVNIISANV